MLGVPWRPCQAKIASSDLDDEDRNDFLYYLHCRIFLLDRSVIIAKDSNKFRVD